MVPRMKGNTAASKTGIKKTSKNRWEFLTCTHKICTLNKMKSTGKNEVIMRELW